MTLQRGYARYAWFVLAFTLLVILWGAYVRASGSGAGCGSHWPLCNGELLPRSPAAATLIEFGHRLTSGAALLLVVGLAVTAWRRFPAGHRVRRAAGLAGILMVTEALIGAGLVLFEYVADDARIARGFWVAGHLVNTFLLVAALTLTPVWAEGVPGPRLRGATARTVVFALALAGVLILGTSGAVTALGDTLFPVAPLSEGEAQTFSGTAHVFVRLRIWHPTLAIAVGAAVVASALVAVRSDPRTGALAQTLVTLFLLELGVGLLNVWWLAPIGLQLVHLLLADLVWIALVVLTARAFAARERLPTETFAAA